VPIRGFFFVIDAQQSDSVILECRDVIRERASKAEGNSPVDLCIENVDFVAEPAKHDRKGTILSPHSAVEEWSLKLTRYDANFFARFPFGELGTAQVTL
jgi:hypothetical protein